MKAMVSKWWDGRVVVGAAVVLWLAVATGGMYAGHGTQVWRWMGVYAGSKSFGDARIITKAWDNVRQGHGAYDKLPDETLNEHFNYPRLWLLPRFFGLGQQDTVVFACTGILFFYLSIFLIMGRLTASEALIYVLALCSPANMLAVERGNIDLYVFGLVALAVLWAAKHRTLSETVLWFAAMLKIFPVFAFPVCFRENKRRALTTLVIASCGFLLYVLATFPDMVQIRAVTPHPTLFGFGCMTLVDGIGKWQAMHGHQNNFTTAFRSLGLLVALAVALSAGWSGMKHSRPNASSSRKLDAFRAGALIYIGVFFIGNNYEYRLIFLLLCLGQLLVWMRNDLEYRAKAALAILALLLAVWERWPLANALPASYLAIPVAQIAHWSLLWLLAWFLGATMPDWIVKMLGRVPAETQEAPPG